MIQFTARAEFKTQAILNDKAHTLATFETESGISGIVTTDGIAAPFDTKQTIHLNLGTGPAFDAITVGRKYLVTIEEVAE